MNEIHRCAAGFRSRILTAGIAALAVVIPVHAGHEEFAAAGCITATRPGRDAYLGGPADEGVQEIAGRGSS